MSSEVYCGYVCGEQHQVAVEGFVRVGTEEQPLDPCCMRQPTEILGADGTTVSTGHLNGSMRNMELRLGRPLQRAVCTLHQAELPLRKMFEHLYGPTTGPQSYSGPIGKLLKSNQLHLSPLNHHFTPLHLADIPHLARR